jgi:hypothetical protein
MKVESGIKLGFAGTLVFAVVGVIAFAIEPSWAEYFFIPAAALAVATGAADLFTKRDLK